METKLGTHHYIAGASTHVKFGYDHVIGGVPATW
jgi:hypothetical protein